jgi:hypothetical protein
MKTIDIFLVLCYNLTIVAGTAYVVQFYDWSPWWFLLAVMMMLNFKSKKDEDENCISK